MTEASRSSGTDGYDEALFEELARLEEGSWWFQGRNQLIAWALERWFPAAGSLLEVGCGTGFVLGHLAERFAALELTGGDPFESPLELARKRAPRARISRLDALALPSEFGFDVVSAFDVLEHIGDDRAALAGLRDAAVPGGGLLVTVPQHRWLWSVADDVARHERRYTRRELDGRLRETGWEPLWFTSFVSLALPLMLLSRMRYRLRPGSYSIEGELEAPPVVNRICGATLAAERALIRRGLSLPAGGSLLAVARRR